MNTLNAVSNQPRAEQSPAAYSRIVASHRFLDSAMKLKCLPEDFRVEELSLARPDGPGRYTFYRLAKQGLGTLEAVEAICRRWNLSGRRVSYAGLKDRHASTVQYLTIADGPWQPMIATKFQLEPAGRLNHAYTSAAPARQSLRAGPPRPRPDALDLATSEIRDDPSGRAAELFRRSAVRIRGVLGRVRRPCLAARRPRAGLETRDGRAESVRPRRR